jgi:hypothetical protein
MNRNDIKRLLEILLYIRLPAFDWPCLMVDLSPVGW